MKTKSIFSQKELSPLLEIGLTSNQSIIYLTLLREGICSILELSKLTGIARGQLYEDTEKLISEGLAELTRKQKRKYLAVGPHKLLKIAKEKITKAQDVFEKISTHLPILESIPKQNRHKALIKYYEGIEGIKEAYSKELDACKETEVLSLVGSLEDIYEFFPENFWEKWNKEFVLSKSKSRMLCHKSPLAVETSTHDSTYNRETRYLEKFPLKVNMDVFGTNVLIVSYYDELALWIDSRVLSDSYRIMFEALWPLSKIITQK